MYTCDRFLSYIVLRCRLCLESICYVEFQSSNFPSFLPKINEKMRSVPCYENKRGRK